MQVQQALNYKKMDKKKVNFKANIKAKKKNQYDNIEKVGMFITAIAFPAHFLSIIRRGILYYKMVFPKKGMSTKQVLLLDKKIRKFDVKVLAPTVAMNVLGLSLSCYKRILKFFRRDRNKMGKDHIALFNEAINKPQKCQKRS